MVARGQAYSFLWEQIIPETLPTNPFTFRTIARPSEGAYREKGSRFLAFAYPVSSEAAIKEIVGDLQRKYFDARHHCYAWILGPAGTHYRAFDAGEPNHSAGDPILGQIRSRELTNVLVVVVRYFGGVKLGVGGLVAAYRAAAADALDHAEIVEKTVTASVRIGYDYAATPEVMRMVKEFDLSIQSQTFETECELVAEYNAQWKDALEKRLALMKAVGVKIHYEIDIPGH